MLHEVHEQIWAAYYAVSVGQISSRSKTCDMTVDDDYVENELQSKSLACTSSTMQSRN
jgi:hypothetical protein